MFGRIVMEVGPRVVTNPDGSTAEYNRFDDALDEAKHAHGATPDTDLDAAALQGGRDRLQGDRARGRPAATSRRTRL